MFHPNVAADGGILLDDWRPCYDILAILTSIQSLLGTPNMKCPADLAAAELYRKDWLKYERKVAAIVERSLTEPALEGNNNSN